MLDELKKLRFARFRVEMEAQGPLRLPPYKGATLRGAFGSTFKRVVCVRRDGECAGCLVRAHCAYSYVFETPATEREADPVRNYTFAPHPFVMEPPEDTCEAYETGELLSLGLVLIGRAIDYLPYFIYALDEMGQRGLGHGRGKARLARVLTAAAAAVAAPETAIYTTTNPQLASGWPVCSGPRPTDWVGNAMRLRLATPARLKDEGRLTPSLDFALLIRSLLRRASELTRIHCEATLGLDYREWIDRARSVQQVEAALRWHDWERYSRRQETRMKMGGLVGTVVFAGELAPFVPLVTLGLDLHVGKGTSFGLGRYEIF
jgi:hypothetical protein